MKKSKRIICFCLVLVMILSLILSLSSTAFATELSNGKDVCNLTISLIDQSGGYPGDGIKVIFKSSAKEEALVLTKEGSWGKSQVVNYSLTAPTEYGIVFEGLEEGYEIMDTTTKAAPSGSFDAKSGESEFFGWAIVSTEQMNIKEQKAVKKNKADVTNSEVAEIYNEFLDAVAFIENDESWYNGYSATMNQYGEESVNRDTYSKWYADNVYGGSEEEYFAMSAFEQFLWTETYTRLANAKNGSWSYDYFFGSKESFASNITDLVVNTLNGNNAETVKKAYLKLMDWQFDYITKNGEPFNFIRNRSYSEEIKTAYVAEPEEVVSKEEKTVPIEEVQEEGVWDETMGILAKNAVSIIVLIILGGATFALYYMRKIKNIDGEHH